jgi:hypothetical protein
MLHNLLLIAFLLTGFPIVAQRTVLSFPTDLAVSSKDSNCQSFIVPDERTGKTTIVLKGSDKAEYLLVNKNFEIESTLQPKNGLVNTIFGKDYEKYLAGVRNNLGSCFYYMIDRNHFSMEVVDFTNGSVINKPVFDKPDDEKNIEWFTSQGRFYLLAVNEKLGELALYVVDENGVASHKNISVDLSGYNPDKLTVREYFSYSHVFYPRQETELIEATELTKIYPYPGKIIMIVGNYKEPPHIWTIDLQTYNVTKKKMDLSGFTGFAGKREKFSNNTYLYGDNLYVLHTSRQKIEIGIFDFISGKLIKKHEITESSDVPFIETPVELVTNNKSGKQKQNVIGSNKELIKELFKGSNGIALAHNSKGQIILNCGVYDKETGTYTPEYTAARFEQKSMPTGRIYAGSNIPVMRTYSDVNWMSTYKGRTRSYSFTRTVNFKVALDSSDFKVIATNEKLSTIDKINHFLKSLPAETQAINTFITNNNYYLGYYLPKEKSYVIKEMEK